MGAIAAWYCGEVSSRPVTVSGMVLSGRRGHGWLHMKGPTIQTICMQTPSKWEPMMRAGLVGLPQWEVISSVALCRTFRHTLVLFLYVLCLYVTISTSCTCGHHCL